MNAKTNTAQSLTNQIARQKEDIEYSWWSLFSWLHCQRTLLVKAPQSHTGHTILQHKWNKPYLWMDSVNLMPSSWRETQRRTLARNMDDHITVCPLPAENAWQLSFVTFSKNQGVMTTWPTWLLTTTCTSNDARLSGNRGHFTRERQGNMRGKSEYPRLEKHFVNCQLEVDKGKLTAGVKFYKADVSRGRSSDDESLTLETSASHYGGQFIFINFKLLVDQLSVSLAAAATQQLLWKLITLLIWRRDLLFHNICDVTVKCSLTLHALLILYGKTT